MSAETSRKGQIDIDLEISTFVSDELEVRQREREKEQNARRELDLKIETKDQERRVILTAGDNRAVEIIQESGLKDVLEQARNALARHYPSATLAEREVIFEEDHGLCGNVDYSKKAYQFRLGWKPTSENAYIRVWDPSYSGNGPEFDYIDVICNGWRTNITHTGTIANPFSYERRGSLVISCGLPSIQFWDGQWQDSEKLKLGIIEAVKRPCRKIREIDTSHGYYDAVYELEKFSSHYR